MTVDLSSGTQGIVAFDIPGSARFWSPAIAKKEGDVYTIRWESGWYKTYHKDGKGICSGVVLHVDGTETPTPAADCIEFIPCAWNDPRAIGLPGEHTP